MNRRKKIVHAARRVIQAGSICFFFLLLKKTVYPVPDKFPAGIYFRSDPLLALSNVLSIFHFPRTLFPALLMACAVLAFKNFFCFWICPLGALTDFAGIVSFRRKWPVHLGAPGWFRKIRIYTLWFVLLGSFAVFLFGFPFTGWALDPFVILTRGVTVRGGWLTSLLVLLLASLIIPRLWCNNICPLGALYFFLGYRTRDNLKKLFAKKHGQKNVS